MTGFRSKKFGNMKKYLKGLGYLGYSDMQDFDKKEFSMLRINEIKRIIGHRVSKKKAFEKGISSYGLKHIVEAQPESNNGMLGGYISNGEMIYAMILLGFDVKRIPKTSNAHFNISRKSLTDLSLTRVGGFVNLYSKRYYRNGSVW